MTKMRAARAQDALASRAVDFVVITALEEERDALLLKLGRPQKLDKEASDVHTYYRASVRSARKDRSTYHVIVTCLSNMGPTESATRAALVVKRWSPKYVLLVGIACGVGTEVAYGDVLAASQVADYTLGKQHDGRRDVRWNVFPCGASLLDSAINLSGNWQRRIGVARPSAGKPVLRKGVVASGGDVIADDEVVAAYSANWPKLVGIEMEAGGVAAAVAQTSERPEFLMIKGVSDFGKDKHEPDVLPWRDYACHAAAAFARGLIESGLYGPAQSESEKKIDELEEATRVAERRWSYLQKSSLLGLEIKFILKSSVGQDWFRKILDDTQIHFSRTAPSIKIGKYVSVSPPPNTKEHTYRWEKPICNYWEQYDPDPKYWVQKIEPEPRELPLIAGIDIQIPWRDLNNTAVTTLESLGQVSEFGIGIPPEAFTVGVEEFELVFSGEQFSFEIVLSDHGLEFLHEMAQTHYEVSASTTRKPTPLSLGSNFSGFQLLEMFRAQLLPGYRASKKKHRSALGGMSGPGGKAIAFYPSMPVEFTRGPASSEYSFTISVPDKDFVKARVAELEGQLEGGLGDVQAYGELAARYSVAGRFLDSIKCLEDGVNKFPSSAELIGFLGETLGKLGRHAEALARLQSAEQLEPKSAGIQSALAICLSQLGRDDEALPHFSSATALDTSNSRHHSNLGRALASRGEYNDAIREYEKAVELAPDDSNSLLLLGVLHNEVGDINKATLRFEASTQVAPDDPDTHEHLGRHLASIGEHERASSALKKAIEIGETARRFEFLGGTQAALCQWPEAEASFRKAFELGIETVGHLVNAGICAANQGKREDAVELFEKAVALDPNNTTAKEILQEMCRATTTK